MTTKGILNCERDKNGWRIPRAGTKSRRIYEMLLEEKSIGEILAAVGGSYTALGVLIWKIRNPDKSNHRSSKYGEATS